MASDDLIADTVDDTVKGCFGSLLIFFGFSNLLGLGIIVTTLAVT